MLAVVGCGAMGTAVAVHLRRAGREVALCATEHDGPFIEAWTQGKPHPGLGVPFPDVALHGPGEWEAALAGAEAIVLAVSTAGLGATTGRLRAPAPPEALWVVATKGWDEATLRSASALVCDEIGDASRVVTIVGPSLAGELAGGIPTAMVCASADREAAGRVAGMFDAPLFRPYLSDDVTGVEVGAALKNVVAIAIGMCDGLAPSFPPGTLSNTKAFLFSRGLVEIARLARAIGGRAETVLGLAGAGDLYVTAIGGRNGRFGALVGRGVAPAEALKEMATTVEGYANARAAVALADRHRLDLPIVRAVKAVLHDGADPRTAIEGLLDGPIEDEI